MKKKSFNTKLNLNKSTVSSLNQQQMNLIIGANESGSLTPTNGPNNLDTTTGVGSACPQAPNTTGCGDNSEYFCNATDDCQ